MQAPRLKYVLIAIAVQTVWGITPSASRLILEQLPVEVYAAIRYSVAGLIFLGLTLARHGRLRTRAAELPKLMAIGIVAYGLDALGTLHGLKLGGVLNFALASSLNAVITAGVSILVLKEKVGRSFIYGSLLSVAGGILLVLGKYDVSSFQVAIGSLCLIWGAYALEAIGFVFSRRYKERLPLTEYIAILQLSAAAFMWIVCFFSGSAPTQLTMVPMETLGALAFVCLVPCCACYLLLYWLLNQMDGHKLAFFDCFHTLAAAALGVALFHERFNRTMILGGALLIAAVVFVGLDKVQIVSRPRSTKRPRGLQKDLQDAAVAPKHGVNA